MGKGDGEEEGNEKVWGAEVGIPHGVTEEAGCEGKFHDGLEENALGLHGVDERVHQVRHDGELGVDVKPGTPHGRENGGEGHQSTPPRDGGIQMTRRSQVA